MKNLQQWFDEYAVSHQNKTNQLIHYICVPTIFFSIVGMLMSIPSQFIAEKLQFNNLIIENWATTILIFLMVFYIRLSFSIFIKMFIFSIICMGYNFLV
mgnify:CR=1 FL=1